MWELVSFFIFSQVVLRCVVIEGVADCRESWRVPLNRAIVVVQGLCFTEAQ